MVGDWPPTTFIKRKIDILSHTDKFKLMVGAYGKVPKNSYSFKVIRLPQIRDPLMIRVLWLLKYLIIGIFHPIKTLNIINISKQYSINKKQFFNRLLKYLSIAFLDFDVIHFEWVAYTSYFLPLLRYLNKVYTVSIRGRQITIDPLLSEEYKKDLYEVLKGAASIHCVSKALENETKKIYKDARTKVIYNGIDTNLFKCKEKSASSELNIVFIGNLIWKKGIDSALFIFYRFLKKGGSGKMYIIGDGDEKERMYSTMNNLGISHNTFYLGKKTEKEVAEILMDMDALLLPSFAEGLANVILEAMATCTVPIVSNVHGNSEPIKHKENGFVFPLLDMEKPASYLYYLYTHPDVLSKMKKSGRKTVEDRFTLSNMQKGHIEFFEEVLV